MGRHGEELRAELIESDLETTDLGGMVDRRLLAFTRGENSRRQHGEERKDRSPEAPEDGWLRIGFHF
jgi:hypothetical protein